MSPLDRRPAFPEQLLFGMFKPGCPRLPRTMGDFLSWPPRVLLLSVCFLQAGALSAATPVDEAAPWPRILALNGTRVTLHLPQVETWTSNSFTARAAVAVKPAEVSKETLGVVWFQAKGTVDKATRIVTLDGFEMTKARFPEAADGGSNALAAVEAALPKGARTVSLDYLIAALGFEQAAARQGPRGLKHTSPEIIWATNRTVLILVDGDPIFRPLPGDRFERAVNTPEWLLRDTQTGRFYLGGEEGWFVADSIAGSWSFVQRPPAELLAIVPGLGLDPEPLPGREVPRVIVRTRPAELIVTSGLPDFKPIRGTSLQYAADCDSQLFFHTRQAAAYVLISGRWFTATSLSGPWSYVPPKDLPADFARIPPGSPQAIVLASVPGTTQAELAILANTVPTTATIQRKDARLAFAYDGEPLFKAIDGTTLSYAVNAQLPVIRANEDYYALENGVWFVAQSPTGPWEVAVEVPEEIYTIPPSAPVYYATFARVYQATEDEVEVGYTAGYQGNYEADGTVVYGTGWSYDPWNGTQYYGWGWTWGYSYVYVPWYQWWIWRHWWNPPGGLRGAVIENIYDRWHSGDHVTHHPALPNTGAIAARANAAYAGHPILYGRHWPSWPSAPSAPRAPSAPSAPSAGVAPSSGSAPLAGSAPSAPSAPRAPSAPGASPWWAAGLQNLPANAVALNPYSRPTTPARPGEVPRGAQLLTDVRQSPSGGRDLYASPDGQVYQRRPEGWYRRQPTGGWQLYAPTQGALQRPPGGMTAQASSARGSGATAAGVYRPQAAARGGGDRSTALANRLPNSGLEARPADVAALERQYYARSLAQTRAQNWRGAAPVRPATRAAIRRR